MGLFDMFEDHHEAVYGGEHEGSLTHELLAGAASFEAMKAYERHREAEGDPANHQTAKELLAGFAGAEVDKLFETRGLDYLDRDKARAQAQEQAAQLYDERYAG